MHCHRRRRRSGSCRVADFYSGATGYSRCANGISPYYHSRTTDDSSSDHLPDSGATYGGLISSGFNSTAGFNSATSHSASSHSSTSHSTSSHSSTSHSAAGYSSPGSSSASSSSTFTARLSACCGSSAGSGSKQEDTITGAFSVGIESTGAADGSPGSNSRDYIADAICYRSEWSREALVDGEHDRELDLRMGSPLFAILNGGFPLFYDSVFIYLYYCHISSGCHF